ncbi:MAG: hypothetical protein DPW18_18490 [Chloroflexi bacterium]|nr:hypothetical protein [Chloroflexota bacterium]MDL1944258.1 hypothetical protein [Chloroflexi bacterium CFX2]
MKNNHKLGAALAILGIAAGLLAFYLIASQYNQVIGVKLATDRMDEAWSVRITYAVLGWIGTASTAIWAAALYGFLQKKEWAWFWGAVAATIQLLVGFFPAIPAMDSQLPTPTLSVFALGGILWFGMLFIGGVEKKIITLTFIAGLAYVLTFIDGVAPIAKFTTSHDNPFWNGMYVMTQQVSWWGAAAWAIFIFAVFKKKSWSIPVGIFASVMSMLAGYPLGLYNALVEVHRFSMFLPAPLFGTGLLIYLLLPSTRKMLEAWNASA